jgi:hypothetical protein
MGAGPSVQDTQGQCAGAFAAVYHCKKEYGFQPQACYPESYDGQCDRVESELKKCMAFVVDPSAAAVFYDSSRTRSERSAANKVLQKKLQKVMPKCTPSPAE